jgi:hypothetical protein
VNLLDFTGDGRPDMVARDTVGRDTVNSDWIHSATSQLLSDDVLLGDVGEHRVLTQARARYQQPTT